MINIKYLFNDIYTIMGKKQTFFEIILHLTFVMIIMLLIVIFYWDTINRKIIRTSRCRISLDNSDNQYNIRLFDKKTNTSVININYDNTNKHNSKIDCVCPSGKELNIIKGIPIYDNEEKKVILSEKNCYCDTNYKSNIYDDNLDYLDIDNIILDGDNFLIDYYGGLLDDIKGLRPYKEKQLTFPN